MPAPDRAHGSVPMHRRTFLKTAGVAGAAAGLEGILGARRAPAFAQGTTIHLLQWVDFIPEGDVEVRRQVVEYQKQTKVEVIVRDHQRQRSAGAHHRGDPVRLGPRHHHDAAQLAASVRRRPGRRQRPAEWKAPTRAATTRTRRPPRRSARRWMALPYSTGAPLIAYRKSWFAEAGLSAAAQDARGVQEARHRAQEEGQARRPDARPHLRRRAGVDLSVHLDVRRAGDRPQRQEGRAQLQGHPRGRERG